MSNRENPKIVQGWLDISLPGQVEGELWARDRAQPIRLHLTGYPASDLAGRMLTFTRPADEETVRSRDASSWAPVQRGVLIRLTCDPVFCLEWINEAEEQLCIQGPSVKVQVSDEPLWTLSPEQVQEQERLLKEHCLAPNDDASDDFLPMDEFEWERSLKESDEMGQRYAELLTKYEGHPDADRLIAVEMGWEDPADEPVDDEADHAAADAAAVQWDDEADAVWDWEPDPAREGIDWIRAPDGDIRHPLTQRVFDLVFDMRKRADALGIADDVTNDPSVHAFHDIIFQIQLLAVKLAGALNGIAYDRDVVFMAGMIVAQLKRALSPFNDAVHRMDELTGRAPAWGRELQAFRPRLFLIREEMLRLMNHYRGVLRDAIG